GMTTKGWGHLVNDVDAVVHLTGYGLEHWPWTKRRKKKFADSRVLPGPALVSAIESASRRPRLFLHHSGISYYGLRGDTVADESSPPANDFLARLTVESEGVSRSVEYLGVRRVVVRSAVVLARRGGLFPLMALPVRLFFGGRFGEGGQSFNWIHVEDHVRAMRFFLDNESARGAYNLIAPPPTSMDDFMRAVADTLHRPYWFHLPTFLLRMIMGEMSILLTEGRFAEPGRMLEAGFSFRFGRLDEALNDLFGQKGV
ncbi:MAG TPA: TIGR01777 family oxidoreductase, partial [Anaerolineales bacterium]|nr:TIGR01777 family oxidoreductase [Anaerolineales bacterium]